MIHSGSRGLGHQVATDALVQMEKAMGRDGINTNDRQLACACASSVAMRTTPILLFAWPACPGSECAAVDCDRAALVQEA